MNEQAKKSMIEALEYVKSVLEVIPVTAIPLCEAKIAAYKNTEIAIRTLSEESESKELPKTQEE